MGGVAIQFPGVEKKVGSGGNRDQMERQLEGAIQHALALGCAVSGLCHTLRIAARYVPDATLDTIMDQIERASAVVREVNRESVALGIHAMTLPQAGLEGGPHV